jgi:pimeloyl-ACP methyl ester carboxylesterase
VAISRATATSAVAATSGATPFARPTPAAPITATISAAEAAALSASYYAPVVVEPVAGEGAPGVVLVHGLEGSRADWATLALELQVNGFAVLAVDLRGHGASPGPADWGAAAGDVAAAWRHLSARPEVDRARTALVGAGLGANLALIVGANNPDIAAVAALSPGDDYQGLRPAGLLPNFGDRPVFLVASRDDAPSYQAAQAMLPALANGDAYYYLTAGHGVAMLAETDLPTRLLSWLAVQIGEPKG